jgi:hypothetical protein
VIVYITATGNAQLVVEYRLDDEACLKISFLSARIVIDLWCFFRDNLSFATIGCTWDIGFVRHVEKFL